MSTEKEAERLKDQMSAAGIRRVAAMKSAEGYALLMESAVLRRDPQAQEKYRSRFIGMNEAAADAQVETATCLLRLLTLR